MDERVVKEFRVAERTYSHPGLPGYGVRVRRDTGQCAKLYISVLLDGRECVVFSGDELGPRKAVLLADLLTRAAAEADDVVALACRPVVLGPGQRVVGPELDGSPSAEQDPVF